MHLPYDPKIIPPGIHPREMEIKVYTKTCTWMFLEALFIILSNWKQFRFTSEDEQLN